MGNRFTGKEKISHNEIVLDAECGTGRVTKIIEYTVKKGKVYAVDTDDDRIANAKKPQGPFKHRIQQIRSIGS